MPETLFVTTTDYVALQPGQPYRLFPFGSIHKGGVVREITPEVAAKFKLPHFKPAIKLGSHDETTPAGGSIISLEVREDGLYAVPEFTDKGAKALEDGDYRYHSPEVVWEDAGFEDPTTGEIMAGPFIVGDALLHMPHLGEAAALFETKLQEVTTMEKVKVTKSVWEQIKSFFDPQEDETPVETPPAAEPVIEENAAPVVPVDEFEAIKKERDELKAAEVKREADRLHAELIGTVKAELATDEYGGMYVELAKVDEAAGMLASMTPEQREWCERNFKAYAAHVKLSNLEGEIGSEGTGAETNPKAALLAAVQARMDADKSDFSAALTKIATEQPDLVKAAGYK